MRVKLKSNAKINIGLNVLRRLENGYHDLEMIMAPIELSDILEVEFLDEAGDLKIYSSDKKVPSDKSNIVYKIYEAFFEFNRLEKKRVELSLIKNIPSEAGLGGGSSNGASFLLALNDYYLNGKMSIEEMIDLSKSIGADIPFFIINKTALVKGIGEKIEEIENALNSDIILIKPNFGISTKLAYEKIQNLNEIKFANIDLIKIGLKENNTDIINSNIENSLHQSARLFNENILDFENSLAELTGVKFFMSGSGSCYFAILEDKELSEKVYKKLKNSMGDCFISLTKILK